MWPAALILSCTALIGPDPDVLQDTPLPELLKRAGAYVQHYHWRLQAIVAEESYVQRTVRRLRTDGGTSTLQGAGADNEERTLRSDFMLLRGVAGEDAWFAFRDVFEVDGRPVSSLRGRLEGWLGDSRTSFMQRARALALEQARYNIGPVVRTINVPTLALEILVPSNQERFRFRRSRDTKPSGAEVSVVSFEERRRPTMIRTPDGKDIVAKGTLWIETATGRVVRTELRTGDPKRGQVDATITVTYAYVPRLELLLPESMQERYLAGSTEIACTARYSNFRRFETDARIVR
jgi:hypothetical protein